MVHFEQELAGLKNMLLRMASHSESAVKDAVDAVSARDIELAARVRVGDAVIDRFEVDIDEMSIGLLSKAPLARDLRLIAVTMKISQNLERVGDEATKIAKRARDLSQEPPLKLNIPLREMADLSLQMLHASLDAFVNQDPVAARALIPRDKEVDALNKDIHRQLANQMIGEPETISRCLNLMVAAKSLERIADHAKNVAEEVVYLCEAEDIRHSGKKATSLPAQSPPNL
jgi:phosphate transport system protein